MVGRQPATDDPRSHGGAGDVGGYAEPGAAVDAIERAGDVDDVGGRDYPVLVGRAARLTPGRRIRSGLWLTLLVLGLGVLVAVLIGVIVVIAGVIVSDAIN